eukprot:3697933-Amphidinium_carterae.1
MLANPLAIPGVEHKSGTSLEAAKQAPCDLHLMPLQATSLQRISSVRWPTNGKDKVKKADYHRLNAIKDVFVQVQQRMRQRQKPELCWHHYKWGKRVTWNYGRVLRARGFISEMISRQTLEDEKTKIGPMLHVQESRTECLDGCLITKFSACTCNTTTATVSCPSFCNWMVATATKVRFVRSTTSHAVKTVRPTARSCDCLLFRCFARLFVSLFAVSANTFEL